MVKRYVAIAALALAAPASAGDYIAQPIAGPADTITYDRGTQIVTRETLFGFITLVAVDNYFGRPSLVIQVANNTDRAFNFGTENLIASVVGETQPTEIMTRQELDQKAQNRAMWAAVLTGLANSGSGYTSYSGRGYTPYGTYSYHGSSYNAGVASLNNRLAMADIQNGLQARLNDARQNSVQTTTIQPGQSYAGRIVFTKPKAKLPNNLALTVSINGMGETFEFQLRK